MLSPNTLLQNRYLVSRLIEMTDSGTIYLAEDRERGGEVQLKEITDGDEQMRRDLEQEAERRRNLHHPALPEVIDSFTEGDNFYVVTPRLSDDDLAKLIQEQGAFPASEVARWGASLLDALDHLHTQEPPVIHGHIRPENLKLTSDRQIVLTNLSQESALNENAAEGDAYSSPEQTSGDELDARSDLYSLGATLYHLLTAKTPPDAQTRLEAIQSGEKDLLHGADEVNEEVPANVAGVIHRAMSLNRDERYASAAEMRDSLQDASESAQFESGARAAADSQSVAETQALAQPYPAQRKTSTAPWIIGAVAVLAIAAVAIILMIVKRDPDAADSGGGTSLKQVKLSSRDMEIVFQEMLHPQMQMMIAQNPEQKKRLVKQVKEFLSIAQQAEAEGYGDKVKPELKAQIASNNDKALYDAYKKKNPGATATEQEINAFYEANPTAFDDYLTANPEEQMQIQMQMQMGGQQGEEIKKRLRNQVGEIKVLADRARKDNLENDEVVRIKQLFGRSSILATAYMDSLEESISGEIKPEDVDEYYNTHQGEFDEVHARHILFITDGNDGIKGEKRRKAEEALSRLRNGEDFATLALELSEDPSSKPKGGDLGYISKGRTIPEFEKALFALQPGQMSDIVETEYGYHIIRVEDRKTQPSLLADDAGRQRITDIMKQERMTKRIEQITASSKIEVAEDFNATPKPMEMPPMGIPGHGAPPPPPEQQ